MPERPGIRQLDRNAKSLAMTHLSENPNDEQLMDLALRLAGRSAGLTAENPAVGCVIARKENGRMKVVGRGFTQKGGRPHAERVALAEAGDRARGATAYVTLEPCAHFGKTSPCALALIEAGIARVACAHPDPDPRVAGGGFSMLRDKGIDVEVGLLETRARKDLAGFLSRTVRKRPWLQAKMALSADCMIGKRGIGNYPVTGSEAKTMTYGLRARSDAILIGSETALVDDPALTVRLPGLEATSPLRILLDSKGRIPVNSALVRSARAVPLWIITTAAIATDKALELEAAGCRILLVEPNRGGHVDLSCAMQKLAEEGINTLFVETGAKLAKALLHHDLVDEFFLYRAPTHVGPDGILALDGEPEKALRLAGLELQSARRLGKDRMEVYIRPRSLNELA